MSGPAQPAACPVDGWLAAWLRAGLDHDDFWRRTPRELAVILEAALARARDAHDLARQRLHEAARLVAFAMHDPKSMPGFEASAPVSAAGPGPARSDAIDQLRVRGWFISAALRGPAAQEDADR